MNRCSRYALFIALFLVSNLLFSQKTMHYDQPDANFEKAIELYRLEKYGAAQNLFKSYIQDAVDPDHLKIAEAEYYSALCAINMYNPDAQSKIRDFTEIHSSNSRKPYAQFQMANYQFTKNRYRSALKSYKQVDPLDLTKDEREEYYFKSGYCYLKNKDLKIAESHFYRLKSGKTKYAAPATYYYGHIAYQSGKYQSALESFNQIKNNNLFSGIVPYYITQIYYLNKDYDKLLEIAPDLLKTATKKRAPEISKMIGEAYYAKGDYQESVKYFASFIEESKRAATREENYQMAYSNLKSSNFLKASDLFQMVAGAKDSLSQNAYYHLGICFLELDKKQFARTAFQSAYILPFDRKISEDALFNYAQLTYELESDPYNSAIGALQEFLEKYPNSEKITEARQYLVSLYFSTKNFKKALESIESLSYLSPDLQKAYQKILYSRGIEMFNDNHYGESAELFKKSIAKDRDVQVTALSRFWLAETFYRQSDYDQAIKLLKQFLNSKGAFTLPEYAKANYNLGYAYFKQKDYTKSLDHFRKFNSMYENKDLIKNDGLIRIADCYFINRSFGAASEYYSKALEIGKTANDYALYQKAISTGVEGDKTAQISILNNLINKYPASTYTDNAYYEIGNALFSNGKTSQALNNYQTLIDQHPSSPLVKKSLLKTGLIYYNEDNSNAALKEFKKVVEHYPSTDESRNALISIRNIYVEKNQVPVFFEYVKTLSHVSVSDAQQDSTTYLAAENTYMNGDCNSASRGFNTYLKNYPKGAFSINAHYYLADCEYKNANINSALQHFSYVADKPSSKFSESALQKAAYLNFKLGQCEKALNYYKRLEVVASVSQNQETAIVGQMRCHFELKQLDAASIAANKLLRSERLNDNIKIEAHMVIAKGAMAKNDLDLATREFNKIVSSLKNETAAEAKYFLCEIDFSKQNLDLAETGCFELINDFSSYDYWVAKSFILLADIYKAKDNLFQAKHTLQSIIDNYDGEDLVNIAKAKLRAIVAQEEALKEKMKEEELEIEIEEQ